MKRVRVLDGVEISVEWRDGSQIIVAAWPMGEMSGMTRLLDVLAGDRLCKCRIDGDLMTLEVRHTDEVDRRIMDLVDILTDIRVLHPTMMQLKLKLTEAEGEELLGVLNG